MSRSPSRFAKSWRRPALSGATVTTAARRRYASVCAPSVLAALLAGSVAAFAGANTFFTSIGDLIFPFVAPSSSGQNGTIGDPVLGGMAPVNGNLSYRKIPTGTGFSYTFGNYMADMLFTATGTLAAGYVTMAPAPVDGGKACISSNQIITALYISANTGQTIVGAVSSLAANARTCYLYSIGNKTWDMTGG